MMKFFLSLLIGLCILFGLYWFLVRTPHITNTPPRQGPIVAFGDSLVQGVGATEGNDFVSLVSRSLNEPIENRGVSGDTTADGLARLGTVIERHPSIAIVLFGGNDYLKRIPQEETFANLRSIITRLQEDGAVVVLLGVRGGLIADNYAPQYERLARQTGSVYVSDVLKNLIGNRQYMYDQIHPNDDGYAIIAERVFAAVRPLFK